MDDLIQTEIESFRGYAEENRTKSDGSQSQWADYSLRALDELIRLREENEKLEKERDQARGRSCAHEKWEKPRWLTPDENGTWVQWLLIQRCAICGFARKVE